jgi:hypothetical protein
MALLDLSLVTKTLMNLLEKVFKTSPEWSTVDTPSYPPISASPPDSLSDGSVGIYLYHISEDIHYKNQPSNGNDIPPVRHAPMALNLYYLLTAKAPQDNTLDEQKMMGIAVKALHDYPLITDSTEIFINSTSEYEKVLPDKIQGRDNRLRIVLQPLAHNEAVSYWTAGSSPLRLSAYYQVSVVFLEPEETKTRSGRVLSYGVHTFVEGAPRLDYSQNSLSFSAPGGLSEPREVLLRPAQVPVGGQVTFSGAGLTGDTMTLLLKSRIWAEPVEVDSAWRVAAEGDHISVTVQETISGQEIFPGIYSAVVKVVRHRRLSSGEMRSFEYLSNECPFAITPRIDSIVLPAIADTGSVEGYRFRPYVDIPPTATPPEITSLRIKAIKSSVQVYLGSVRLTWWEDHSRPLAAGEFTVPDPVAANELQFRLPDPIPDGVAAGDVLPVRIFVNGAESPPNWIVIP